MGPMDDATLVEAARSGDGSAWAAIYDRYADRLHDHCHRILHDRDEAADALHDAFAAAAIMEWRGLGNVHGVHVGTTLEQCIDGVCVFPERGEVQRSVPVFVTGLDVRARNKQLEPLSSVAALYSAVKFSRYTDYRGVGAGG